MNRVAITILLSIVFMELASAEKLSHEQNQNSGPSGTENEAEVVRVLGTDVTQRFTDLNATSSFVSPDMMVIRPASILDMLAEVPGVAENSQAGLFQVYSIRGLSRQRVLTYIGDIPLKAERRAGVATSFIHPMLFQHAEVLKGPASTLFQSGSIGGVVRLAPRYFNENILSMDYSVQGNTNSQVFGAGGDDWSFGLARQQSSNAEDARGNELNDAYKQYSLSAIKKWQGSGIDYEWLTLASKGEDIGRSSLRYPDRLVTVPDEKHLLSQFSAQTDEWRVSLYAHPNEVNTLSIRPGNRENLVTNTADDFGVHFESRWAPSSDQFEGVWGLDGFSRQNIDAVDRQQNYSDNSVSVSTSLNDAYEREFAAFGTLNKHFDSIKWQFGARFLHNQQGNTGLNTINDDAVTGFTGVAFNLEPGVLLKASLGTGIRFATVSERFYTGTTGRGAVVGNPNLEHERSISVDLGLHSSSQDMDFKVNVYHQLIHDYIERVEVDTELLSYRNVSSGKIYGGEVESSFHLSEQWDLSLGAMFVRGEDEAGQPLADIPASRVSSSVSYLSGSWEWEAALEYRVHKDELASGEKQTPAAWVGQFSLSYDFSDSFEASIFIDNLFDEEYFSSADDIVPYAQGRDIGVSFTKYW